METRVNEIREALARLPDADRCTPTCPGWIISEGKRGRVRVEVCDECNERRRDRDRVNDADVALLPEAQTRLKEVRKLRADYRKEQAKTSLGRRRAGHLRVRAAMTHIEAAQVELARASMDLSAVVGFVQEGERLSDLHSKVKALWYRLEEKLRGHPGTNRKGELNREPLPEDLRDGHYHGCGGRR